MALGSEADERTPATAYIQHGMVGLERDLSAVQLCFLRLVQRRCRWPIGAASGQAPVVGRFMNFDWKVAMRERYVFGALQYLAIVQTRGQPKQHERKRQSELLSKLGGDHLVEKLVERQAIPIAIHISLAQA
jgi:hypothetical protein